MQIYHHQVEEQCGSIQDTTAYHYFIHSIYSFQEDGESRAWTGEPFKHMPYISCLWGTLNTLKEVLGLIHRL